MRRSSIGGPSITGPSTGSACQVADARSGDSKSPQPRGAGGGYDPFKGEGTAELTTLGDILVDVDTGPGGTGLMVWIVGG